MTDDTDDLDEFARMFGAKPATPPEGLIPPVVSQPTAPVPPATVGSPVDPLAWLTSPTAALPTATALAEPTQVLPTRRSIAAEAAAAARDTGRRNLIILGSVGGGLLVLIIVLVLVLVTRSGSSGSPDAFSRHTDAPSQSSSSTPSATPTPTATETPTPTPTATEAQTVPPPPPPPSPPTVTAAVSAQPNCSGSGPFTVTIGYTSANAATLNVTSSDGSVNVNITPGASGTTAALPYQCGTGESFTLTVYSSAEGVTPASATVTPVPN